MDDRFSPQTDQRASVRPISFALQEQFSISEPVALAIRPEDLTRNEPRRASVHQTLGREVGGWVDDFGEGLPSVTMSGHTGWGTKLGTGKDGFQSFEELNDLVVKKYSAAKQKRIDMGLDPADVKLLFIDLLDNFAWSVVPTQFVLRRSRSRPLLFQYNITLQAIETTIDGGLEMFLPPTGNLSLGMGALGSALDRIGSLANLVRTATLGQLRSISGSVMRYVNFSLGLLHNVQGLIGGVNGYISGAVGSAVSIAREFALAGSSVFKTLANIGGLSVHEKSAFMQMGAAFNEVLCIFSNALKPRATYEDYNDLYGASNCSSTTGGRTASPLAGANVFSLVTAAANAPIKLGSAAISSLNAVASSDPVLAPVPQSEVARHLDEIVLGTKVAA